MFRKIISGLAFSGLLAASGGAYAADAYPVNSPAVSSHQPVSKSQQAPHSVVQVAPQSSKVEHQGQSAATPHQQPAKIGAHTNAHAGVKK